MRRYFKIAGPVLCASLLLGACSKAENPQPVPGDKQALVLAPSVDGETKAAANYTAGDYFGLAGYDEASVLVDNVDVPYVYSASGKELRVKAGSDPFYFPAGGTPLTFTVKWPTEAQRLALGIEVAKDQSEREVFLRTDYLSTTMTVLPTNRVLISLGHERSKATFTLDGALYGKKITRLTVSGYTAYCDPALKDAQLVFVPQAGTTILAQGCSGALQVEGSNSMYTFTLAEAITGFEAGSHHTIKINVD